MFFLMNFKVGNKEGSFADIYMHVIDIFPPHLM